eukprot:GFYU01021735.1.p1 GENE.GFYU01021735.1~~GFYU01021735.1.p1  ORF type:complete len:127 (-),score=30.18 GFYU01021735.1:39-419(-)
MHHTCSPNTHANTLECRCPELISAEDLTKAALYLKDLQLPVQMRKFDSGVIVLQTAEHNDTAVSQDISDTAEKNGSVTSVELAAIKGISPILATEELKRAEQLGFVCRDDSIEGLRFYPNFFLAQS